MFLSPVKPKVEEDKAEDVDNDGDDGDDDAEVVEDEEDEEVGRKVEDSSSSFRLVCWLSSGTKLNAALSYILLKRSHHMLPKTK